MICSSYPPADDLIGWILSIDWRRRSLAGLDAVLVAAAVIHALFVRALPHLLRAVAIGAQWLAGRAAVAEHHATVRVLKADSRTVVQLRSAARLAGHRVTPSGRRIAQANRVELLELLG